MNTILALALAFTGALVAVPLMLPLPWFLGPLLALACANVLGARLPAPPGARDLGQWIIGTALGLYFTSEILRLVMDLLPWIVAATAFMISISLVGAAALHRTASVDRTTSFFAMAIGGAAEMTSQAERYGARTDRVVAAHSLRLVLVAVSVPFAMQLSGVRGTDPFMPVAVDFDAGGFAMLAAATGAAALMLSRLRAPNVFMIGPLLAAAALTATGNAWSSLPTVVLNAGQLLVGIALGTRFAPEFFRAAPRFLAAVSSITFIYLAAAALFGWWMASTATLVPATAILATTPGGIGEMALTAKLLNLGAPIVTAFHAVRMVLIVLLTGPLYRALRRLGGSERDPQGVN